ncbi:DUF4190 domain-containing protein [Subtercola lobariae]|uniref:DUF4190 domain-containing protein n=1 Tax=Subtercola lobariae TaxID=1588641 RepID=A0A917B6Q3_9MICO|nr:DUF4190 domain-containing protein [Subtercola lobariae]GGF27844.1 hypothetical protein GCM10011399_21420 [Subtercola lobariae]
MTSDDTRTDARPFNSLAIVSFVCSFVVSLAAVITGHIALSQIKRRSQQGLGERGRGLAIAGVVIGYAGIAISIVTVGVVAALFVTGSIHTGSNAAPLVPVIAPDLTFAAGQSLKPESTVAFTDSFAKKSGWNETKKDYGDGNSQYSSPGGTCTVKFARTPLESVQVVKNDDKATTDNLLAMVDDASYADVGTYADSSTISQGNTLNGSSVDVREMGWSGADGAEGATLARAFTAVGYGLSADISCPDSATLTKASATVSSTLAIAVTG